MEIFVYSVAAGVSFAAGALWRDWHCWLSERRTRIAQCAHKWGEPMLVPNASLIRFPEAWVQFCEHCRTQRHCNEDGSEYVPTRG